MKSIPDVRLMAIQDSWQIEVILSIYFVHIAEEGRPALE
jgi:hypothetical protein